MLIVGCGCRGRALGAALAEQGHAVRGTTRAEAGTKAIEAGGIEPAVADPDRLGTVMATLPGVSVVVWLLGAATGSTRADVHGPRLETLLERLVDTPVRGFVYESDGAHGGRSLVETASARWRIPAAVVERGAAPEAVAAAVEGLLAS